MKAHRSRARRALVTVVPLALVVACCVAAPAGAATRRWVSGVGDDINPCSRTAPCKTLAGAISKTDEGGEINALDNGGFGAVTITKAITIDLSPQLGGVLNSNVNGVTVNAGATDDVILRGLEIHGGGAVATCPYGGLSGIWVRNARSVNIEQSRIASQQVAGLRITAETSDPSVFLNGVDIRDTCAAGIAADPAAGHTASVMVRDSTITRTATAVHAADGAHIWLTGSTIFANTLGLEKVGTGAIDVSTDTQVTGNTTDGTPSLVFGQTGLQGPAGAQGPAGPTGPQGPAAFKLVLATTAAKLSAKVGRGVSVGYVATAAAAGTLTVRKGTKTIATVRGSLRSGRHTMRWNGKRGKKAAGKGSYRLLIRAVGADGQVATASARLTLG